MADVKTAYLTDRGVVRVAGPDAQTLLQGLVTNDVPDLAVGSAVYAGLLTPQGKILFDFIVSSSSNGGYLIDCDRATVKDLIKRLTLYRLRADVSFEDLSDEASVMCRWGDETTSTCDNALSFARDPRHADLGFREVIPRTEAMSENSTAEAYHTHRIALGVPEGGKDFPFGDTYPHEALFDELNGVSFTKGCFVGQEVVSRMEHRNATKKRVIKIVSEEPLPEQGAEIVAGDIVLGRLGSSVEQQGLGLVRVDRLSELDAKGLHPEIDGVTVALKKPDWARFEMP